MPEKCLSGIGAFSHDTIELTLWKGFNMVLNMLHCGCTSLDSWQEVNDKINGHVFVCPFVCHFVWQFGFCGNIVTSIYVSECSANYWLVIEKFAVKFIDDHDDDQV